MNTEVPRVPSMTMQCLLKLMKHGVICNQLIRTRNLIMYVTRHATY